MAFKNSVPVEKEIDKMYCKIKSLHLTIVFLAFAYGEATAQLPLSCEEAFASFAQTIVLAKSVGAKKIKAALDKGTPLSLLEDTQHDLISKGWVFPPPLDPNDSKAIHNALNQGAVTVALKSSVTPKIGYKVGDAILALTTKRILNKLFWMGPDLESEFWRTGTRTLIKTGKISQEELNQFEQELNQVGQELQQILSAADELNIVYRRFGIGETRNNFITPLSGHRHRIDNGSWITATYTVYGPAGTLFETGEGKPSAAFPGQVLLLSDINRNYRILPREEGRLPLHATPHLQGRRLVIVFEFILDSQ